jgi:hypothetical protein
MDINVFVSVVFKNILELEHSDCKLVEENFFRWYETLEIFFHRFWLKNLIWSAPLLFFGSFLSCRYGG